MACHRNRQVFSCHMSLITDMRASLQVHKPGRRRLRRRRRPALPVISLPLSRSIRLYTLPASNP